MNLTKLFAVTSAITFAAASLAFADQSQPRTKLLMAKAQKSSEKETKSAKEDRSRFAFDPIRVAALEEMYTLFRKDMEPTKQLMWQAKRFYQEDKLGEAERLANEAIVSSAKMSNIMLRDGRFSSINGASKEFSSQAREPQHDARILIGRIRMKQRFYDEALQIFRANWKEDSDKRLNLDVALCLLRTGNMEMARKFATEEILTQFLSEEVLAKLPPTNTERTLEARILFMRGRESSTRFQYKEALANYKAAIQLMPEVGVFAYFMGEELNDLKRYSEAIPYYRMAISRFSSDSKLMKDAKTREQNAVYLSRVQREAKAAGKSL